MGLGFHADGTHLVALFLAFLGIFVLWSGLIWLPLQPHFHFHPPLCLLLLLVPRLVCQGVVGIFVIAWGHPWVGLGTCTSFLMKRGFPFQQRDPWPGVGALGLDRTGLMAMKDGMRMMHGRQHDH